MFIIIKQVVHELPLCFKMPNPFHFFFFVSQSLRFQHKQLHSWQHSYTWMSEGSQRKRKRETRNEEWRQEIMGRNKSGDRSGDQYPPLLPCLTANGITIYLVNSFRRRGGPPPPALASKRLDLWSGYLVRYVPNEITKGNWGTGGGIWGLSYRIFSSSS